MLPSIQFAALRMKMFRQELQGENRSENDDLNVFYRHCKGGAKLVVGGRFPVRLHHAVSQFRFRLYELPFETKAAAGNLIYFCLSNMTISIIVPTYNEADGIQKLVSHLKKYSNEAVVDLMVSDGGSEDDTIEKAKAAGATALLSPRKGRAAQMNYGALLAKGDVLYFVHADSFPPKSFVTDIAQAVSSGYDLGRYRTRFASPKVLLKLNAWFTRFDLFVCMGGDQTLFIRRQLFEVFGGFKEDMRIMEEYEFCSRARKTGRYKILPGTAIISARKYDTNNWWQVQKANSTVVRMYKKGASQQDMLDTYKRLLSYRKNAF